MKAFPVLLATTMSLTSSHAAIAQPAISPWDSVAAVLKTKDVFAGGYHRFNLPRRDVTLRLGDVTVAPELALGSWAGFTDDARDAMAMGDLVLKSAELKPVLSELERQDLDVTAIHNHLAGEEPELVYVHFHGHGTPTDLARRIDRVLSQTATPRPVGAAAPVPLAIDTSAVFRGLGQSGRARGSVAQLSFVLVPGTVQMDGMTLNPALAYASPVSIQALKAGRAVASGDFAVPGDRVQPMLAALSSHGITATAVHTHMIGETPKVYFIHFWADGSLADVVAGLRATLDAARP